MWLIYWLHLMLVINNNQERQRNPTVAITDFTQKFAHQTLIHFKMVERQDFFMQYSVPSKRSFWLFVSVKKIMVVKFLKRRTLIICPNNLWWWFIRLQHVVSTLCQQLCMVLTTLQNPENHRHPDVWSTHQAMQDSHLGHSRELMEITRAVIIATRTHIR